MITLIYIIGFLIWLPVTVWGMAKQEGWDTIPTPLRFILASVNCIFWPVCLANLVLTCIGAGIALLYTALID